MAFFFGLAIRPLQQKSKGLSYVYEKSTTKTVASVMSAFTTTMDDLNNVAENNDGIVADLQIHQETIAAKIKTAGKEADQARAIHAKLADLMDT